MPRGPSLSSKAASATGWKPTPSRSIPEKISSGFGDVDKRHAETTGAYLQDVIARARFIIALMKANGSRVWPANSVPTRSSRSIRPSRFNALRTVQCRAQHDIAAMGVAELQKKNDSSAVAAQGGTFRRNQ